MSLSDLTKRVAELERVETAGAVFLTLTRINSLAIPVAPGVVVDWEVVVRNSGFTWEPGATITIPQSGYYFFNMVYVFNSASVNTGSLIVNGIDVSITLDYYGGGRENMLGVVRHFTAGDQVAFNIAASAARTMQVFPYGGALESPFLHVVKLA